jgi:hypothetical protein
MNVGAEVIETGLAASLYAAAFLADGPLKKLMKDRSSIISLGAGMATAYVFVHVMPELANLRHVFTESVSTSLRYEGMAIYFVALVGFLVFYVLNHLHPEKDVVEDAVKSNLIFKLHISSFAIYVWLMSYLLIHQLEKTSVTVAMFALAITLHFLAVDRTLRNEHGSSYDNLGRYILGGMAIIGWVSGLLFSIPHHILTLLVAFISGGIVLNSTIMELPSRKEGRFVHFIIGGLVYGLLLLPLG